MRGRPLQAANRGLADETAMSNKPDRAINIHGHLRRGQDIRARIRIWEEGHVEKSVCLCLPPRWSRHGYFTNADFLLRGQGVGAPPRGRALPLSRPSLAPGR